jgi:CRP-like cAMP-binding protein
MIGTASPLARKLTAFADLNAAELDVLDDLQSRRRSFTAGREVVVPIPHDQTAFILTEGWALSYRQRSGGARQIVDFRIPGDFLGLRSMLLQKSDRAIAPVTPVVAAEVRVKDMLNTMVQMPRLGFALMWTASRDEALLADHVVSLSRRNAAERTAHFLLELAARMQLVGLGGTAGYDCPLTHVMMAEALGISAIHINRVLRQLREAGFVTFEDGRVHFGDFEGLADFADFDRAYLDHSGPVLV